MSTSSHGGRINEFCPDPLMHKGRVDLMSSFDFAYRVYKQVLPSAGYVTLVDTGEVFECFFMGAVGFVRTLFKLDEQFLKNFETARLYSHIVPRAYLLPSFQSALPGNISAQFSSRANSTCRQNPNRWPSLWLL